MHPSFLLMKKTSAVAPGSASPPQAKKSVRGDKKKHLRKRRTKKEPNAVLLGVSNALCQQTCDERLVRALLRSSDVSDYQFLTTVRHLRCIASPELRDRMLRQMVDEGTLKPLSTTKRMRLLSALSRWDPDRSTGLRAMDCMLGPVETRAGKDGFPELVSPQIDLTTAEPRGNPVRLSCRASVRSLLRIDTAAQQFSMRMHVEIWLPIWRHPGLCLLDGNPLTPESWNPQLECTNAVEMRQWDMRASLVERGAVSHSSQHIRYAYDLDGTFSETLELAWFPFDRQQMSVKLHLGRSPREVHLEPLGQRKLKGPLQNRKETWSHEFFERGFLEDNIWTVVRSKNAANGLKGRAIWVSREKSEEGETVDVSVLLRRRSLYYVWNIYLPMFLLTLMTGANLVIPVCEVADRLSVNLTLILTAVAYKFIAAQDLPNVAYLTFLDTHVLVCLGSLFASVVETGVLAALKSTESCESGVLPWKSAVDAYYTGRSDANGTQMPYRTWEIVSVTFTLINLLVFCLFNVACVIAATACAQRHERLAVQRLEKKLFAGAQGYD